MKKVALDYQPSPTKDLDHLKEITALKKAEKLTQQQQQFLDLYLEDSTILSPEDMINRNMRAAGYTGSRYALDALGRNIINWYEANTSPADIFRRMDLGETQVVRRLKDIIETTTNKTTILQALKIVANGLAMFQQDNDEDLQGAIIQIGNTNFSSKEEKIENDQEKQGLKKTTFTILR